MDTVITRIIEIEREAAMDIQRAEDTSRQNIEAHRRALEEEKERVRANIISTENSRLTQAAYEAKSKTEATSAHLRKDWESLFQDPALNEAIKEDIISILLEG
jgi:hypothetical protein